MVIELAALITMLKALGLKALIGKLTLAWKGLHTSANAGYLKGLAHSALKTIHCNGAVEAAKAFIQMLLIIGAFAAGTAAYCLAIEALEAFSEGNIEKGLKKANKAYKEAKSAGYAV